MFSCSTTTTTTTTTTKNQVDQGLEARWYLVRTKPRQEFKAQEELIKQGYTVFLPLMQVEKIVKSKRSLISEPLFQSYLFIKLNQIDHDWGPIRSTKGVAHLVRFGGVAASLESHQIAALEAWSQDMPERKLFDDNQLIEVIDGAFKGMEGFFQRLHVSESGEERAMLLMSLFGREQRISVDVSHLRPSGMLGRIAA
jgi:transcriptional antiterminator RfaH